MSLRRSNQENSLFHPFSSDHGLFSPLLHGSSYFQDLSPKVDVYSKEDKVTVNAELPGFKKEDLHIDFSDNLRQITISGTKKRDETHKEGDATYSERSYGSFSRTLSLPHGTRADDVKAKYDNGVLEIIIPRDTSSTQRKIQIS
ncbi:HSP20-like chaperone [Neoconidiobolus thromboides FSU 785]|nr:HSP20-like chaperone [Neoconidiobolus thromboides FSU 785]